MPAKAGQPVGPKGPLGTVRDSILTYLQQCHPGKQFSGDTVVTTGEFKQLMQSWENHRIRYETTDRRIAATPPGFQNMQKVPTVGLHKGQSFPIRVRWDNGRLQCSLDLDQTSPFTWDKSKFKCNRDECWNESVRRIFKTYIFSKLPTSILTCTLKFQTKLQFCNLHAKQGKKRSLEEADLYESDGNILFS